MKLSKKINFIQFIWMEATGSSISIEDAEQLINEFDKS